MDSVDVRLLHKSKPEVGEEVTVLWDGEEYKCKVRMVEDTRVKVHYKGWSACYDQWVSLPKPQGGEAVAVRKDLFREPSTEPEEDVEDLPLKGILKKPKKEEDEEVTFKEPSTKWTRKDLAERCRVLGLSDEGVKAVLVERIKKATQKDA